MDRPNGIAFRNGTLYIAEGTKISKLERIEDHLDNPPTPVVIYDDLPNHQSHGWRFIAIGPDHKLYILAVAVLVSLAALSAAAAALEERLAPCLACHGAHGQSTIPEVPSLGAQPAFYVTIQLYMFRERMRVVEPLHEMTQGLSDDDVRRMAEAMAKLPPPLPAAEPPDPARLERAGALIQQHRCNFCHNQDFSGAHNVPRLAGQREDYLVKALREYKSNARRGYDASMADVMYPVTDADILDLAHFLARLR